jgi:hypothetical protein
VGGMEGDAGWLVRIRAERHWMLVEPACGESIA